MKNKDFVIGVDFGTGSVRSLIMDAHSGQELAASEFLYPRWREGRFCEPSENQFRQHPLDHIEGLEYVVKDMLTQVDQEVRNNIRALSVDTTGSTPIPVDEKGIPLSLKPGFEENPNAMFFLWKDHSAVKEAEEINTHALDFETNYLKYSGGIYSSEWYWAKLLYVLRTDDAIRNACHSWVEHCDWIPFLLTGEEDISKMKRNVCAAGHKALWAEEFGGYPPEEFFSGLDPVLEGFRTQLPDRTFTSDKAAGTISTQWAKKLGLSTEVMVGIGALDAHIGAVGGQIVPYYMSKVMGTSTCDMLVAPSDEMKGHLVKGISGQVEGSIIPGMLGMEAGQSAFGDIYAWFRDILSWPLKNILADSTVIDGTASEKLLQELRSKIIPELSKQADKLPLEKDSELAVDWLNGRRTPDANQFLKGAIHGLSLGSDAPRIFRSLVESTCFGSRRIIERFKEEGVRVEGIIGVGGVAKKSPFVMQMMADILGMPIKVHKSEQTCALGASMFAATVAGIYPKVDDAMQQMGQGFERAYFPDKSKSEIYNHRYEKYKALCGFIENNN
ncbi:ribulokinase [Salegentibacter sp. F14]